MMDPEETVTLTLSEYSRLVYDSNLLQALEFGGVDNWEWYCDSIENWEKENGPLGGEY